MENRIKFQNQKHLVFVVSFRAVAGLWNEVNEHKAERRVNMTRNEILYQQNLETNRSNLERERETHRANLANESEAHRANVARETETAHHNRETESHAWASLAETHRAATVRESQTDQQLAETARANRTKEAQTWNQLAETRRSNLAEERIKSNQVANQAEYWDRSVTEQQRANQAREQQAALDAEQNKFLSLYNSATKEQIATLDRESRETIAQAQNEVSKRGQNMQLINKAVGILGDLIAKKIGGK